jgi:hypothetical protein
MVYTLKAFREEIEKILRRYPNPDSLQQLTLVIEEFARIEKKNMDKIITRTLYSNTNYTKEEIETFFMKIFREHFNI